MALPRRRNSSRLTAASRSWAAVMAAHTPLTSRSGQQTASASRVRHSGSTYPRRFAGRTAPAA